jgi:ABC-2 type transport system ATP-binding protein
MGSVLEVSQVDQVFRVGFWLKPVQVLHQIQLKVPERSVFGFLGANGAGKTTLIHLITGLRKPTRGEVKVLGYNSVSMEAKSRIGYLPERPYFHEHLTGEGMLKYFGVLSGMPKAQILSRIPVVLSKVGLNEARKVELKRFSKGMLQRIGIAQALLHDPEFLILDEPMSGLDPMGRKDMRELIVSLSAEGRTIFFSSHVIPDVEAICDQVGLIQKGKLIGCGPIGEFLAQGPLSTEIGFTGVSVSDASTEWPEFTQLRQMPDGYRGTVPSQEVVHTVLKKLIQQNAKILWVSPIRPSLETLFERSEVKSSV